MAVSVIYIVAKSLARYGMELAKKIISLNNLFFL